VDLWDKAGERKRGEGRKRGADLWILFISRKITGWSLHERSAAPNENGGERENKMEKKKTGAKGIQGVWSNLLLFYVVYISATIKVAVVWKKKREREKRGNKNL